ncbi:MAG: YgiQ family radical SAM protein [Eubacteriales bacterium]|nr:YgiQ family radical SAM protein [Eubacteriales bacterium]
MQISDYTYDDRFLPLNRAEMQQKGWEQADFVYIIGDAYVDHPSFGHAIISRMLELYGYKVAIISQPDWKDVSSIDIYGKPRLGFLVSGGNMDSMVNHYSVSKKRRATDAYTPGGEMGKRPDYATIVYCNLIRRKYKNVPIIIGGIEASLRRLAHYDYWSNKLKHSVLVDSQADILIYGMGEHAIIEIAEALDSGIDVHDITYVDGTVYRSKTMPDAKYALVLPDYEALCEDKLNYARSFKIQYDNTDHFTAKTLVEKYNDHLFIVQNRPAAPLTEAEMDRVYSLDYTRTYHPSYESMGGVPAISEVKFSLVSNRGCFGGCSFCALTFHQGRMLQTRSHKSIIQEAEKMVWDPEFKGYIHDVGGPTANFRIKACDKQLTHGVCANRQCLFPKPCPNLKVDHSDYMELLRKLRELPNVKKVFIRSGIRFDYLMADSDDSFFYELCKYHISGQLKVAPEHVSDNVLKRMGKPENSVFKSFCEKYKHINEQLGMKQYMVPYLMSSHPGSTMKDAVKLAEYLRDLGYMPEQVQDFYPTPSTMSTCMYYTGVDPRTMEKVYVPTSPHEKAMQRALIQYRNPKNYDLVYEALTITKRTDLIGFDKKCLIRPRQDAEKNRYGTGGKISQNLTNSKKSNINHKKTIRNVHKKKKK